jgi:hypothetical protein
MIWSERDRLVSGSRAALRKITVTENVRSSHMKLVIVKRLRSHEKSGNATKTRPGHYQAIRNNSSNEYRVSRTPGLK